MGNCLIKKLQQTVEDENLKILGEWEILIKPWNTNHDIRLILDTTKENKIEFVNFDDSVINKIQNSPIYKIYTILEENIVEPVKVKIKTHYDFNNFEISGQQNIEFITPFVNILKYSKPIRLNASQTNHKQKIDWLKLDFSRLNHLSMFNMYLYDSNNVRIGDAYDLENFWTQIAQHSPVLTNLLAKDRLYWPSENFRPTEYTIFKIYISNDMTVGFYNTETVDNYLINISRCQPTNDTDKNIRLNSRENASRSTRSNQAIKDLATKGYSVYIDNILQTGNETFDE